MVLDYLSTVLRQSSKRSSRERQEFHELVISESRSFNQKSAIPSLHRSVKHQKGSLKLLKIKHQKIEKVIISDFLEPNEINFVEKNFETKTKIVDKI